MLLHVLWNWIVKEKENRMENIPTQVIEVVGEIVSAIKRCNICEISTVSFDGERCEVTEGIEFEWNEIEDKEDPKYGKLRMEVRIGDFHFMQHPDNIE